MQTKGEVEIKVSPDGHSIEVDAQNFTGKSCKDFMGPVMKAIGNTIEEKKKPDFYKQSHGGQTVGQ